MPYLPPILGLVPAAVLAMTLPPAAAIRRLRPPAPVGLLVVLFVVAHLLREALHHFGLRSDWAALDGILLLTAVVIFWVGGLQHAASSDQRALVGGLGLAMLAALGLGSRTAFLGEGATVFRGVLVALAVVAMAALLLRRLPSGVGRWLVGAVMLGYCAALLLASAAPPWPLLEPAFASGVDLLLMVMAGGAVLALHYEGTRRSAEVLSERLRSVFDNAPDPMFRVAVGGRVLEVNPALRTLLGVAPDETFGPYGRETHVPPSDPLHIERLVLARGVVRGFAARLKSRDGTEHDVSIDAWLLRDGKGEPQVVEGVMRDLTEELRLRRRVDQGQRLESLGRLAAGIAHDFNNLLTGVLGSVELAVRSKDDPLAVERELGDARDMILRGAGLTRQLLAFGREQAVETETLDLDGALSPIVRMLRRMLDSRYRLEFEPAGNLPPVRASTAQIEQVVTNLVLNARDAMPDGGVLSVRTLRTSTGVQVVVEDQGQGMDEETLSRIFEPFFTTKGDGQGVGMGLASTYGTVRQLGGEIDVESVPGAGTTFRIDLPAAADEVRPPPAPPAVSSHAVLDVLVASDVPPVREYVRRMLEVQGHRVRAVASLEEAVRAVSDAPPHVLVTEAALPGHTGPELVELLGTPHGPLGVVYLTGMAGRLLRPEHHRRAVVLPKPFSAEQLSQAVDRAMERRRGG